MGNRALLLATWFTFCVWGAAAGAEPLAAFPGAQGYGAASKGGRGGKVVHVTNLNDAGAGSLRAALAVRGPRIIVFDVGGTIELKRNLRMPNDNGFVTVAGQTAPGGITLIGAEVGLPGWSRTDHGTSDVIVRHLRVRGVHNTAGPGEGGDAFEAYWARRVVVDHCSFTGACDETVDMIHSRDVTVQWCTLTEPALWGQGGAQHAEGNHNTGFIFSYEPAGRLSYHHNLHAHCPRRNPLATCGPADVRNNVVYNFRIGLSGAGKRRWAEQEMGYNVVANYYRRGASRQRYLTPCYSLGEGSYYFRANVLDLGEGRRVTFSDPWQELPAANKRFGGVSFWGGGKKLSAPVKTPPVETAGADEAYRAVLAGAGAWPRDATTRRVVAEVKARTGEYGLSGPYERFPTRRDGPTSAKYDADRDGMPDAWEKAHGLDPADAEDRNKIVPKGVSQDDRHAGYTYVEFYLNELAERIVGRGRTCSVEAAADGPGLIVCEHGGRTPNWKTDPAKKGPKWLARAKRNRLGYNGNPLEIAWGRTNVFNKGSIVVLKALPQRSLGVGAPVVSKFTHWSGGPADGAKTPMLRLTIDHDMKIVAHFRALP